MHAGLIAQVYNVHCHGRILKNKKTSTNVLQQAGDDSGYSFKSRVMSVLLVEMDDNLGDTNCAFCAVLRVGSSEICNHFIYIHVYTTIGLRTYRSRSFCIFNILQCLHVLKWEFKWRQYYYTNLENLLLVYEEAFLTHEHKVFPHCKGCSTITFTRNNLLAI